jgi:hypothetical protein
MAAGSYCRADNFDLVVGLRGGMLGPRGEKF